MRVYRCPWCGEESITVFGKVFVGSNFSKGRKCPSCSKTYAQKNGTHILQIVAFCLVVLLGDLLLFTVPFFKNNAWLFIWLDIAVFLLLIGVHNYFRAQLVRLEDEKIIPFKYQGTMQLKYIDIAKKYPLKNGDILGVLYRSKKRADTIYPIVFSNVMKNDTVITCEWGFLKPEFVPSELFQVGKELMIVNNDKEILIGTILKVYEEYIQ
jgi:hypothetical protein